MQTTAARNNAAGSLIDLLLRSGEALRNWRAVATLMTTGVTTIIVFMALAASGNTILIALGALLAWLIASVGISATGILLMDQASGLEPRSIGAALFDGLFAALRLFVLALLGTLVAVLAVIAVSILLLLCKIPGIGGLFFAIILPVSVLAMAFIYAGLYFMFCLAGPAVWSGASIRQASAALYMIIRNRLVESALGVILLSLLMMFIGGLVVAFIAAGTGVVAGLSAGILSSGMNFGSMISLNGFGGSLGGLAYGGMFGMGILVALVGALLFCMAMLGVNRLYLHLTADLDLASAEAAITQGIEEAQKRATAMKEEAQKRTAAMQEEARRRNEEMRQRTQQMEAAIEPVATAAPMAPSASVVTAGQAAPDATCPSCATPVTPGDKFCENCGHKLG
jgi:hypothetical protein